MHGRTASLKSGMLALIQMPAPAKPEPTTTANTARDRFQHALPYVRSQKAHVSPC